MSFPHLIVGGYLTVLVLLMIYAVHRYCILFLYFKYRRKNDVVPTLPDELPCVTIQLPLYNEVYVVERLITAAAKLRYPKSLLDIQVLDDSTDETTARARNLVRKTSGKRGTRSNTSIVNTDKGIKQGLFRKG